MKGSQPHAPATTGEPLPHEPQPGESVVRVLVIDDHPVVRAGIAAVLEREPLLRVAGEGANAGDAMALYKRLDPDVVVLDIRLAPHDGVEVCEALVSHDERACVVFHTQFSHEAVLMRGFLAGAKGFVIKSSEPETLIEAIRAVARGQTYVDPTVGRKLVSLAAAGRRAIGPHGLTITEMHVVELLPRGLSNPQIALELGISVETVKSHVRKILRKLHANDRAQAVAIAVREGLA